MIQQRFWVSRLAVLIAACMLAMFLAFGWVQWVYANVTLLYFTGTSTGSNQVLLEWETATELDTAGFFIQRSTTQASGYARLNASLIPAAGDPLLGQYYTFTDSTVSSGNVYFYRLEVIDINQGSQFFDPIQVTVGATPTATLSITPSATTNLTTTPNSPTPTRTRTPTRTSTIPPVVNTATRTPPSAFTATYTPSPTDPAGGGAVISTLTTTPFLPATITPAGLEATQTFEAEATNQQATLTSLPPSITSSETPAVEPAATQTPTPTPDRPMNSGDVIRIGVLLLVAGIWIFLGVWLVNYLRRSINS